MIASKSFCCLILVHYSFSLREKAAGETCEMLTEFDPFTRIEMEELKFQSVLSAMADAAWPHVHLPSSSRHFYHGLADLATA